MSQFLAPAVKGCEKANVYNSTNFFFQKHKKGIMQNLYEKYLHFSKFLLQVLAFYLIFTKEFLCNSFNNFKVSMKFRWI